MYVIFYINILLYFNVPNLKKDRASIEINSKDTKFIMNCSHHHHVARKRIMHFERGYQRVELLYEKNLFMRIIIYEKYINFTIK